MTFLDQLMAAERAITNTAAVARLLPQPDLITRSLERREAAARRAAAL